MCYYYKYIPVRGRRSASTGSALADIKSAYNTNKCMIGPGNVVCGYPMGEVILTQDRGGCWLDRLLLP